MPDCHFMATGKKDGDRVAELEAAKSGADSLYS
jgi:hypothetical protein